MTMLLQSGLLLIIYQFQQYHAHYVMQENLRSNDAVFVKMILSIDEFKSSKIDSKEILIDGEMYDIRSTKYSGNQVELMVIHDLKEGSVFKRVQMALSGGKDSKSSIPNHFFKLFSFLYYLPFVGYEFRECIAFLPQLFCSDNYFDSIILELNSPPPEFS